MRYAVGLTFGIGYNRADPGLRIYRSNAPSETYGHVHGIRVWRFYVYVGVERD